MINHVDDLKFQNRIRSYLGPTEMLSKMNPRHTKTVNEMVNILQSKLCNAIQLQGSKYIHLHSHINYVVYRSMTNIYA